MENSNETIEKYRNDVDDRSDNIDNAYYKWRLCDNNGKMAQNQLRQYRKWTYREKTENVMAAGYLNTCINNILMCINSKFHMWGIILTVFLLG